MLNLYDHDWPIRTFQPQLPPPKFVFNDGPWENARRGEANDSMVCRAASSAAATCAAASCRRCVRVNSYSHVEDSILFEGVNVGRHCRLRRVIVDKDVKIPENTTIGYDIENDRRRGFQVTEQGVVVVPKAEPPETFHGRP